MGNRQPEVLPVQAVRGGLPSEVPEHGQLLLPSVGSREEGKYLRLLPAGVVPAYQKAKEAAAKPKEAGPKPLKPDDVKLDDAGPEKP